MCGIAGWLSLKSKIDQSILDDMIDELVHRGPDDRGTFVSGHVGIGMRRLSIIDVQSGHQPIHNEDQSLWIVYNGEIYNYLGLKADLEAKGHRFYTKSDTETIIHLYEELGADSLDMLRGMFAFAIWDQQRETLFLARDSFGIKPLYYAWDGQNLLFSSEIKGILKHPNFSRRLNLQSINQFFTYGYIPGDLTMFEGIYKLLPGSYAVLAKGELTLNPYWSLKEHTLPCQTDEDYLDAFESVFRDSVKRHLVSDVPVGAFLSGGVDSSLVVAYMARLLEQPVNTFSIGYEESGAVFDERPYARKVARHCNAKHQEFVLKPDIVECLPKIIAHYDEPVGDSSAIPNYYLSQQVSNHVTVALSGLGGDELCAGYERYLGALVGERYTQIPSFFRRRVIQPIIESLPDSSVGHPFPERLRRFIRSASLPLADRYYSIISKFNDQQRDQLFVPDFKAKVDVIEAHQVFMRFWNVGARDDLHQLLRIDVGTYLVDDLLTLTDRVSMAHSLEVRVPFIDREVVEFMWAVPARMKIRGFAKKYLLKLAAERLLPREVIYRKKKGFSVPLTVWFRGALKSYVEEVLSEDEFQRLQIFDAQFVKKLIAEHCAGSANHDERLFSLISFMQWYKLYFGSR